MLGGRGGAQSGGGGAANYAETTIFTLCMVGILSKLGHLWLQTIHNNVKTFVTGSHVKYVSAFLQHLCRPEAGCTRYSKECNQRCTPHPSLYSPSLWVPVPSFNTRSTHNQTRQRLRLLMCANLRPLNEISMSRYVCSLRKIYIFVTGYAFIRITSFHSAFMQLETQIQHRSPGSISFILFVKIAVSFCYAGKAILPKSFVFI